MLHHTSDIGTAQTHKRFVGRAPTTDIFWVQNVIKHSCIDQLAFLCHWTGKKADVNIFFFDMWIYNTQV